MYQEADVLKSNFKGREGQELDCEARGTKGKWEAGEEGLES